MTTTVILIEMNTANWIVLTEVEMIVMDILSDGMMMEKREVKEIGIIRNEVVNSIIEEREHIVDRQHPR